MFLSFGTNVSSLTEHQSVVFSAVLTDPDGISDVIGGTLKSPDGAISYGAFATAEQEGAYSLSLTWEALQQSQDITFQNNQTRMFTAEFYDAAGHKTQETIGITLTCDGAYACSGHCQAQCGVASATRAACDTVCAASNMTCNPPDPYRAAYYGPNGTSVQYALATCAAIPPADDIGFSFFAMGCGCIPNT